MKNPNEAFFVAIQAGCIPHAIGMPGEAKSAIIQSFANASGRNLHTMIGSIATLPTSGAILP